MKEEEKKEPAWDPKNFAWSSTNRQARNISQLFSDHFGDSKISQCVKNWKDYKANSHGDAAVKALDEWCSKTVEASAAPKIN